MSEYKINGLGQLGPSLSSPLPPLPGQLSYPHVFPVWGREWAHGGLQAGVPILLLIIATRQLGCEGWWLWQKRCSQRDSIPRRRKPELQLPTPNPWLVLNEQTKWISACLALVNKLKRREAQDDQTRDANKDICQNPTLGEGCPVDQPTASQLPTNTWLLIVGLLLLLKTIMWPLTLDYVTRASR